MDWENLSVEIYRAILNLFKYLSCLLLPIASSLWEDVVQFISDLQLLALPSCASASPLHHHKDSHFCWVERLLVFMAYYHSCWSVLVSMTCSSYQQHLIKPIPVGQLQTEWEKVWDMLALQSRLLHLPMQSHSSLAAPALLMLSQASVSLPELVYLCFTLQVSQCFRLTWFGNWEDNHRKKEIAVDYASAAKKLSFAARANFWLRLRRATHSKEKRATPLPLSFTPLAPQGSYIYTSQSLQHPALESLLYWEYGFLLQQWWFSESQNLRSISNQLISFPQARTSKSTLTKVKNTSNQERQSQYTPTPKTLKSLILMSRTNWSP